MVIGKGSQGSRAMRILERENYYNVINGYKDFFLDSRATPTTDEVYKDGTTFDEVYALYNFDRELRNIYLKYLLKIENTFKTVIAHEFSSVYGHDNYLKLSNFDSNASANRKHLNNIAKKYKLDINNDINEVKRRSAEENTEAVIKLIGDINQELARQMGKHHDVVTHYMTEHGYIPLWVLVNVLTFGKITNFYLHMKNADRKKVAMFFRVGVEELHKYMNMLSIARNKCAHDERFFDMKFRKSLHTKGIKNFKSLGLSPKADGSYVSGTNDVYAIAIIFAVLLSKAELKEFILSMKNAFTKLDKKLKTIQVDEVMKNMGYHGDWQKLILLKK